MEERFTPPRPSAPSRLRRVLAPLLLALSLVLAGALASPASAAPTRNDSQNEAVYFVHGYSKDANSNCAGWNAAMTKFRSLGWTGAFHTIGYYSGDTNCGVRIASTGTDTSIMELGRLLAWDIYNRHSKYGQSVDVVAHSMGGLVLRAAITGTSRGLSGWPAYIYVEDAVTIGTPHNGASSLLTGLCNSVQCAQMRKGSSFLTSLADNAQAAGGTDWTMIGTEDDDTVMVESATTESGGAGHYVWYYSGQGLEHTVEPGNVSGTYRNRYMNYYTGTTTWYYQAAGQNIITTARNAAYYWYRW
jgi:triacylglycerol esterase/lipase EstA (alpha/beta hydrolase family)